MFLMPSGVFLQLKVIIYYSKEFQQFLMEIGGAVLSGFKSIEILKDIPQSYP